MFYFGVNTKAVKVEPKAKSDELDLHDEVGVLPVPRGGANCVNPQLALMPNTTELVWLQGRCIGGSAEWKTSSTCWLRLCPEAAAQHAAAHVC